jgi:hypothetical protein
VAAEDEGNCTSPGKRDADSSAKLLNKTLEWRLCFVLDASQTVKETGWAAGELCRRCDAMRRLVAQKRGANPAEKN